MRGVLTFLGVRVSLLAKITSPQHIKITIKMPHRSSTDPSDTLVSNSNIKNESIFIKPFLIDF